MLKRIVQICIFIFVILTTTLAQESTGKLDGQIINSNGEGINLVTVSIKSSSMQGTRVVTSHSEGYFHLQDLPVGTYEVRFNHISKQTLIIKNISILLGKTTSLGKIVLKEKVSEINEVVIFSDRPIIDKTSASNGLNFKKEIFETLPFDRNYNSMLTLSPLATESYYGDGINISGSTGWENNYYIDGINVTEPMRGKFGTILPYNFIKEIEIKNGGYEAEFGSALGGIANVITHSGGNKFHSKIFGFFTDKSFAGKNKLGTVKKRIKDFATYDFGISFGGALINKKLWYFLAYNPSFYDQNVEIPNVGIYKDRTRVHRFAGKLTWQASSATNLQFTVIGDPTKQNRVENQLGASIPTITTAGNAEPYLGEITSGGYNLSLNLKHLLNDNFFISANASWLESRFYDVASSEYGRTEPFFMDFIDLANGNFYAEGGYGRFRKNMSRRISVSVKGTYVINFHIIKMGIEYEDNSVDDWTENKGGFNGELPNPIMRFPTPLSPTGTIYQGWRVEKNVEVHNRVPTFFIQDSWQTTDRLRINLGIRWSAEFLIGSDRKIAQKILDEWQPRFGFIYQFDELSDQKLFGSFGRFYERLPLILSSTFAADYLSQKITYCQDPRISLEPYSIDNITTYQSEIKNLEGQFFDEITLGYERRLLNDFKFTIRGTYRNLRQVVEDAIQELDDDTKITIIGNPGKGNLDFLPDFTREYSALEISFQKPSGKFNFLTSYVLSRNYGNYPGIFDSDILYPEPNLNNLDRVQQLVNSTGLLPNDRTHVFKLFGSYNFDFPLSIGISFLMQSGTPLNAYVPLSDDASNIRFLVKRGSVGRTPYTWDLSMRLIYNLGSIEKVFNRFSFILDAFHLFSQREAVLLQQHKYSYDSGEGFLLENPGYLKSAVHQFPMTIRLGMEINL